MCGGGLDTGPHWLELTVRRGSGAGRPCPHLQPQAHTWVAHHHLRHRPYHGPCVFDTRLLLKRTLSPQPLRICRAGSLT